MGCEVKSVLSRLLLGALCLLIVLTVVGILSVSIVVLNDCFPKALPIIFGTTFFLVLSYVLGCGYEIDV